MELCKLPPLIFKSVVPDFSGIAGGHYSYPALKLDKIIPSVDRVCSANKVSSKDSSLDAISPEANNAKANARALFSVGAATTVAL